MNLSREELAMCQTALQSQIDSLHEKILGFVRSGFGDSRGTKEHREELFRASILRNKIQSFLLTDTRHLPSKPHTCGKDEGKQTGYSMADCDACCH